LVAVSHNHIEDIPEFIVSIGQDNYIDFRVKLYLGNISDIDAKESTNGIALHVLAESLHSEIVIHQ
jgi:hypothetical protein